MEDVIDDILRHKSGVQCSVGLLVTSKEVHEWTPVYFNEYSVFCLKRKKKKIG